MPVRIQSTTGPRQQQQQQQPLNSAGELESGCAFCKRNRESIRMYTNHKLKDHLGRVTCPILRRHVCAGCGATGDSAHTRSYCPVAVRGRQAEAARSQATTTPATTSTSQRLTSSGSSWSSTTGSSTPSPDSMVDWRSASAEFAPHLGAVRLPSSRANTTGGGGSSSELGIQLGFNRAFHNMSRVTNSLYNSAGRLRNRPRTLAPTTASRADSATDDNNSAPLAPSWTPWNHQRRNNSNNNNNSSRGTRE